MAPRSLAKGARARQRVLQAVIESVAVRGLAALSVADVAAAAGMSPGHVMYYFSTKDVLFIEALKYSEALLDEQRANLLQTPDTPMHRLRDYIAVYLPTGRHDARWSLWIEVWNLSMTLPEMREVQLELESRWQRDLTAIVRDALSQAQAPTDRAEDVAETISSVLDGVSIRMITGSPGVDRERGLTIATEACTLVLGTAARPDPTLRAQ
jgi:AcrR family transcriptional regulator